MKLAFARVYVCALLRMWCSAYVVRRLFLCPSARGFVSGARRWATRGRTQRLPTLRGGPPQSPHQPAFSRPPVQKRSRTVCPTSFALHGSRRLWVVRPRTLVSGLFFLTLQPGDLTATGSLRRSSHESRLELDPD